MILRNIAVALALGLATAAHADPLTIESQGSFFIGGHDVKSDALSGLSAYDAAGTVTVGQMYVHKPRLTSHPVILVSGSGGLNDRRRQQ